MPAPGHGDGGGRLHLHESARVRARDRVLSKQAFLTNDRPYPIRRNLRQLARIRDDRRVGPRIAQRHIVPIVRLRKHRDGLGVPTPARGEVRGLHLDGLGGGREQGAPFHAGLVHHVAVEQRMRPNESGFRGQRRLHVRIIGGGMHVEIVALMQMVRRQIAIVVAHAGNLGEQGRGAVGSLDRRRRAGPPITPARLSRQAFGHGAQPVERLGVISGPDRRSQPPFRDLRIRGIGREPVECRHRGALACVCRAERERPPQLVTQQGCHVRAQQQGREHGRRRREIDVCKPCKAGQQRPGFDRGCGCLRQRAERRAGRIQ